MNKIDLDAALEAGSFAASLESVVVKRDGIKDRDAIERRVAKAIVIATLRNLDGQGMTRAGDFLLDLERVEKDG